MPINSNTTSSASGSGTTIPLFYLDMTPNALSAAYNPIVVRAVKTPYRIGDLFFVEVYTTSRRNALRANEPKTNATLLTTLIKNGDGTGTCSFDLGPTLATLFANPAIPSDTPFQKDDSAFAPYFYKVGFITFDARNNEVRNYKSESTVNWVLRAALPLSGNPAIIINSVFPQWNGVPVNFLSNMPNGLERQLTEPTLLSTFITLPTATTTPEVKVMASLRFHATTEVVGDELELAPVSFEKEEVVTVRTDIITSGGVYSWDVRPSTFRNHPSFQLLKSYSVWLVYKEPNEPEVRLTVPKNIKVGRTAVSPFTITYLNRLGSWESLHFTKNRTERFKTIANTFRANGQERVSFIDATSTVTLYSPWYPGAAAQWLKDLMLSPMVLVDGQYVKVENSSFEFDNEDDLFSLALVVSPAYEENKIKL